MIEYKEFKLGGENGLFNIYTGRDVIISRVKNGKIPLISHQHDNNGITKYISTMENRRLFNYKETIALADRGVFLATCQSKDFYIGTRVKALVFKDGEKSEKIRLFFVTAINKLQKYFEEYLINATDKLPDLKIMLPVDEKGNINYRYMESCINELEEECISGLNDYLTENGLDNYELSNEEKELYRKYENNEIKFEKIKVSKLFFHNNGDTDIQQKHINDKGCFVVSSGLQNDGIIGKSDIKAKVFKKGTITIDMFGYAFYRDFEYKMVTHARVFSLEYLKKELTKEEGLFLCTQFKYLPKIFSYSNMASWEKIKNFELNIPVTLNGNIDYNFMNSYIKIQEKIAIKDVVDWKNKIRVNAEKCI